MASPLPPPANPHPAPNYAPQAGTYAPSAQRPGGVTYAGILGLAYGSLWALSGLAMIFLGGAFATIFLPFLSSEGGSGAATAGGIVGGLFVFLGVVIAAIAAFGIATAVFTLKGRSWARWSSVVLFSLDALFQLGTIFLLYPAVFLALDVGAIVMLVKDDARTYFDTVEASASP